MRQGGHAVDAEGGVQSRGCAAIHLKPLRPRLGGEWSEEIEEEEEVEPIVGANAGESGDGEEGRQTTRSSSATSASAPAPAPRKKLRGHRRS